jgi:FAD/FMN-containing dehydrogenase
MTVHVDRASRACYRTDGGQVVYGLPDSVCHARSPEDVAGLLRQAQRESIPVTCRGGGLTTEGESVTARGVLLDLKGMNRLLECDGDTAWVEAGMTWHQVAEALRPRGLDYTSAPLNMLSTVGGTLGVGGIDVNSPRHGCSADQAVELEVVTPTGEIVRVKEGDDYLERVLLGYGQFGVITKARIKVRPYRPMAVRHFLYTDVGLALSDMMRLVEEDARDSHAQRGRDRARRRFRGRAQASDSRKHPGAARHGANRGPLRAPPVADGRRRLPAAAQSRPSAGASRPAVRAGRRPPRSHGRVQPVDLALLGRPPGRHPRPRDHQGQIRSSGAARHRRLPAVLSVLHAVRGHDSKIR